MYNLYTHEKQLKQQVEQTFNENKKKSLLKKRLSNITY